MRREERTSEPYRRITFGERGLDTREISLGDAGFVRVRQSMGSPASRSGFDISGQYWILGAIDLRRGSIHYRCGEKDLMVSPGRFGIFLPPWTLVQTRVSRAAYQSEAVISAASLPADAFTNPFLFLPAPRAAPDSVEEALRILRRARRVLAIGEKRSPGTFALRIKSRIESSYNTGRKIAHIARELGIAPAVLTRIFRRSYGLPPVQYRTHLRVLDGILQLAHGHAPIDAAAGAGFNDLGRFYSHFRALKCGSPALYLPRVKKRQA